MWFRKFVLWKVACSLQASAKLFKLCRIMIWWLSLGLQKFYMKLTGKLRIPARKLTIIICSVFLTITRMLLEYYWKYSWESDTESYLVILLLSQSKLTNLLSWWIAQFFFERFHVILRWIAENSRIWCHVKLLLSLPDYIGSSNKVFISFLEIS